MIMEFDSNKPIFMQIADSICERIITGDLQEGARIPSVRYVGADIGVNPNTVMRSYERLTNDGIIFNKRGIGYFICEGAKEVVLDKTREAFLKNELPGILKKMKLLHIDTDILLNALKAE